MKACRGSGTVALFILNLALGEISGLLYAPATLPLGKTLNLNRRLCGLHRQSNILEKRKISWHYRDLNPELSSPLHSCCSDFQSSPCD